jgi:peptidoglycan/LPS O-acetylase OafA/YrhL
MRSTTGQYFLNLDHVRACAVLLVFVWHFNHFERGEFQTPLLPPLSLLTEGHTGVSIFLTLSGYLFAKLLGTKNINYTNFIFNRVLRLFPLLLIVIVINLIQGSIDSGFGIHILKPILKGFLWPTLPNGGWSITVEMHFYLLLPLLLTVFLRKRIHWSVVVLLAFLSFRYVLYKYGFDLQFSAYYTLLGRFDQFALGILAYRFRAKIPKVSIFGFGVAVTFIAYLTIFDLVGGYYGPFNFGKVSWVWIFQLTVEGLLYSILIAFYDQKTLPENKLTLGIAKIGQISYSIYLLHVFVIFSIPKFIDQNFLDISNSYLKLLSAFVFFICFLPIAAISYKYIESPFFKYRRVYIK